VQVIDVGDLAAWIVAAGISGVTGIVTAVGESHAFDNFLSGVSDVVGFTGELVTVDDAWLIEHDVHYWAGPRSLRFAKRNNAAYLAAGASSVRSETQFHACLNMKRLATLRAHGSRDSARRKEPTFSTGRARDWHPWK